MRWLIYWWRIIYEKKHHFRSWILFAGSHEGVLIISRRLHPTPCLRQTPRVHTATVIIITVLTYSSSSSHYLRGTPKTFLVLICYPQAGIFIPLCLITYYFFCIIISSTARRSEADAVEFQVLPNENSKYTRRSIDCKAYRWSHLPTLILCFNYAMNTTMPIESSFGKYLLVE